MAAKLGHYKQVQTGEYSWEIPSSFYKNGSAILEGIDNEVRAIHPCSFFYFFVERSQVIGGRLDSTFYLYLQLPIHHLGFNNYFGEHNKCAIYKVLAKLSFYRYCRIVQFIVIFFLKKKAHSLYNYLNVFNTFKKFLLIFFLE